MRATLAPRRRQSLTTAGFHVHPASRSAAMALEQQDRRSYLITPDARYVSPKTAALKATRGMSVYGAIRKHGPGNDFYVLLIGPPGCLDQWERRMA